MYIFTSFTSFFFVFFFHPFFHLNYQTEDSNAFSSSQPSISPNNSAIAHQPTLSSAPKLKHCSAGPAHLTATTMFNSSTNLRLKPSPRTTIQTGHRPRFSLAASALRRTSTVAKRTFVISFFLFFFFSYLNHRSDDSNLFSSSQPSVTHENLYHRTPGDAAGTS